MKKNKNMSRKNHTYTNLMFTSVGIIIALFLYRYEPLQVFLLGLNEYGYLGAFIAGILFVSTYTAATGALILLILAENLMPLEIGLIAGLGAVVGDLTIFHIVKDGLSNEIMDIYHRFGGKHMSKVLHIRAFRWMLPVIGAIIIASPLPDEIGVSLMGISKMSPLRFALLSYVLNLVGIFLVLSTSVIIKP